MSEPKRDGGGMTADTEERGRGRHQQIAEAFELIRKGSERLLSSEEPLFVNFAVRTLAALRACEAQWPPLVPAHLTTVE